VLDTGNTSWLLVSSALVLLMTPGLAFFYGGLNRSKSVLNMMMMSFSSIGLVSILWLFYGWGGAFGADKPLNASNHGFIGDFTDGAGNSYLGTHTYTSLLWGTTGIPTYVVMAFQMMFAIITVALISGAIAERAKFIGWIIFAAAWFTLAYVPIAHMVWGGGYLGATVGELDFAGGSAVHINAGAAALALAIVLGKRVGWPQAAFKPHNVPFVALGAGLLWFGWFGFNAGSEITADSLTAVAFVNTQVATAAALLGWIVLEWIKGGKPTLVGASSGAVAGLVAITPACAFIEPWSAALLGFVAGIVCALAVGLKYLLKFDDSLDVFGVHFVGGWIGCLWIGLFNNPTATGFALPVKSAGLFVSGGGTAQLVAQAEGAAIVTVWSFVVALVIGYLLRLVGLFKVKAENQEELDHHEHKESAYESFNPAPASAAAGAHAG
jgi:Amt family ammonium transporter